MVEDIRNILGFYEEIGAGFLAIEEGDLRRLLDAGKGVPGEPHPQVKVEGATDSLEAVNQDIYACTRCRLHKTRKNCVPGEGSTAPDIVFIGEGPGETEDQYGRPFVGRAGQLLDRIIKKMGYRRNMVFIGNIVKCRPPGNRDPLKDEVTACLPHLQKQIRALKPKAIVCLGRVALNNLLDGDYSITRVRGQRLQYEGIPVIPTLHPSYILHQRTRESVSKAKWEVWEDMQKVLDILKEG